MPVFEEKLQITEKYQERISYFTFSIVVHTETNHTFCSAWSVKPLALIPAPASAYPVTPVASSASPPPHQADHLSQKSRHELTCHHVWSFILQYLLNSNFSWACEQHIRSKVFIFKKSQRSYNFIFFCCWKFAETFLILQRAKAKNKIQN